MEPTLRDGYSALTDVEAYSRLPPQHGDIVVFKPTAAPSASFIKRIIAIPGDRLHIAQGRVMINGRQLTEGYLLEAWTWASTWHDGDEVVVPPDEYFVMGDNRNHSTDSRFLNFQNRSQFLGKVVAKVAPDGRVSGV
jgi:signal peptidase I